MGSSNLETSSTTSDPYCLPSLKDWGNDKWRSKASCRGADVEWFFPKREPDSSISEGRLICASCSVRKECLDFAVSNMITYGLYGGVAPRDRRLGSLGERVDGSMLFSTVLHDFRRVYGIRKEVLREKWVGKELSKLLRLPADEIREMIKSLDDYVLPGDGSPPYKTHL